MGNKVVSRDEWLVARAALLEQEKELTHKSDELARKRQALPWVHIEKEYRFTTDRGTETLAELFRGRSQLLIYHFMFGPDYEAGCLSCSSLADEFNGIAVHLANHDVMFWAVSRAPLEKLARFKQRMGWTFPWASSAGSDFNFDFHASVTEEEFQSSPAAQVPEGAESFAAGAGTEWATYAREQPGMSAFALENGAVYHTYSASQRGLDVLWGMFQWLDRAPKGRNEQSMQLRHHDMYPAG